LVSDFQAVCEEYCCMSIPFSGSFARSSSVFLMLALAACAGSNRTTADGAWQGSPSRNAPFAKVLVVAVAGDADMRRDLEEQIVRDISAAGGAAVSSITIEANQPHPVRTSENMTAMVKSAGTDAVLVVRTAGETVGAGKTKDQAYVKIGPQLTIETSPDMTMVWASDYTIKQTGSELIAQTDSQFDVLLYDVADNNRPVYRIAVESKYADEGGGDPDWVISGRTATAITDRLRSAGLIR
jgi:hypothetical protein